MMAFLRHTNSLYVMVFNPTALRKAKIVHNFGLSECNRVKTFEARRETKKLSVVAVQYSKWLSSLGKDIII